MNVLLTYKTEADKKNAISFTTDTGRLGNCIFRNLAFQFLVKKHNLIVRYVREQACSHLGISLFHGACRYESYVFVEDENFFDLLAAETLHANLVDNSAYFQTEPITCLIWQTLRENKESIMDANPFADRYSNNNDAYCHIRIGDVEEWMLPLSYYLDGLSRFSFDTLYISTDSPDHPRIQEIKAQFPQLQMLDYDEIRTIQFASTCRHIVLSHGTFSGIIGYLAFFSDIYYSGRTPGWCPLGIFTGKGWNELPEKSGDLLPNIK